MKSMQSFFLSSILSTAFWMSALLNLITLFQTYKNKYIYTFFTPQKNTNQIDKTFRSFNKGEKGKREIVCKSVKLKTGRGGVNFLIKHQGTLSIIRASLNDVPRKSNIKCFSKRGKKNPSRGQFYNFYQRFQLL